jgi:hypothetical protein
MSATQIYGVPDSFKSGTSIADLLLGRWTSTAGSFAFSLSAGNGRFGGQSLRVSFNAPSGSYYYRKAGIGNQTTLCAHFPFKLSALPGSMALGLMSFMDGTTEQVTLGVNSSGAFVVVKGAVVGSGANILGTSANVISLNTRYVVELKVTFGTGTGGTIELHVRGPNFPSTGIAIASTGSLNTAPSGIAQCNAYALGAFNAAATFNPSTLDYEHFMVLDDFLGDKQISFYPPTGNPTAVWTPDSSTNLSRVQEAQENGDASYISSGNSGDIDYYSYAALPAGTQGIFAVTRSMWNRNDAAGVSQARTKIKQGSTIANGATVNPALTYSEQIDIAYVDPVSTIAFVASDVNSLLDGVERV